MRQIIGTSMTNNYLRIRFVLQLRTNYPYPCGMSWRIIVRTIVPYFMKTGVNFCHHLGQGKQEKGHKQDTEACNL